jgi:hypothetical protein
LFSIILVNAFMKDKQYDPARSNERSPAEGFAAVNTHNPGEEENEQIIPPQQIPETAKHSKDDDNNNAS